MTWVFLHRDITSSDEVLPMLMLLLIANYNAILSRAKVQDEYLSLLASSPTLLPDMILVGCWGVVD